MTHDLLRHEFLTKNHLAELFHTTVKTIDEWVKKGGLPRSVPFGGHPLWNTETLKQHVQEKYLRHGYSEAQTANIFARAKLVPAGECINVSFPTSMMPKSAARQFNVEEMQSMVVAFMAALSIAPTRPAIDITPNADQQVERLPSP